MVIVVDTHLNGKGEVRLVRPGVAEVRKTPEEIREEWKPFVNGGV